MLDFSSRVAAIALLCAVPAFAQLPTPNPIPRTAPRAAHVVTTGVTGTAPANRHWSQAASSGSSLFVFGGRTGTTGSGSKRNDLHEFDGITKTWIQHNVDGDPAAPTQRFRNTAAWDPTRGVLVIFGGEDAAGGLLGDTWEWDSTTGIWTDVSPVGSPSARRLASMAYDPITGGILLYGGEVAGGIANDETWLFIAGTWAQIATANSPGARANHSLVTRSDFGDVFLCAGIDLGAAPNRIHYIDAWTWTGSDWSLVVPTTTAVPATMGGNQAVYDPLRQRIVMLGGQGLSTNSGATGGAYGTEYAGSPSSWCSEFDCVTNEWKIYGPASFSTADSVVGRASRYYSGFLVDRVYVWGGQNPSGVGASLTSVKEYQADPIASSTAYGSACASSMANAPSLSTTDRSWTGRSYQLTTTGLESGAVVAGLLGFTQVALPLDAVFPTAAGCELLVDTVAATFPLAPMSGTAAFGFTITDSPDLAGLQLFLQTIQVETSPAIFLSASNGWALEVGAN